MAWKQSLNNITLFFVQCGTNCIQNTDSHSETEISIGNCTHFKIFFPHVTELVVYEIRKIGTDMTNLNSTALLKIWSFPWRNTYYTTTFLIVLTASQRLAYKNTFFVCKLFSKGTATKWAQQCGNPKLWLPLKTVWTGASRSLWPVTSTTNMLHLCSTVLNPIPNNIYHIMHFLPSSHLSLPLRLVLYMWSDVQNAAWRWKVQETLSW